MIIEAVAAAPRLKGNDRVHERNASKGSQLQASGAFGTVQLTLVA
jgi:hypothetical protein